MKIMYLLEVKVGFARIALMMATVASVVIVVVAIVAGTAAIAGGEHYGNHGNHGGYGDDHGGRHGSNCGRQDAGHGEVWYFCFKYCAHIITHHHGQCSHLLCLLQHTSLLIHQASLVISTIRFMVITLRAEPRPWQSNLFVISHRLVSLCVHSTVVNDMGDDKRPIYVAATCQPMGKLYELLYQYSPHAYELYL